MDSEANPNILLFGAGSLGAIYLYLLSKVASVTAVCRSNYEVVKKDGFIINSTIFGQNIHFRPNVEKSCAEAKAASKRPFDYILVCSKVFPGITPELIRPAITEGHTAIVLIQNGIGIEDEYHQAFPTNPIVSCVVYLPATQYPAGVIAHKEVELMELGNYPTSRKTSHAENLAKLIQAAGGTAKPYDDIQYQRWYKLIVNASWNPLCALTRCSDVELMRSTPMATDIIEAVMLEVTDIARAYGHEISKDLVDVQLERAKARIPIDTGVEPSMLQDVKQGRHIEIEAIVGNTIRLAQEKGVKCPNLTLMYVLGRGLDSHIGRERARSVNTS